MKNNILFFSKHFHEHQLIRGIQENEHISIVVTVKKNIQEDLNPC